MQGQRINTAPGRAVMLRKAAERAVDDPVALARAARIIRVALERGRLALEDVVPTDVMQRSA